MLYALWVLDFGSWLLCTGILELTWQRGEIGLKEDCIFVICKREKRLDDPSSSSDISFVAKKSHQTLGLGSVRLKFASGRPWRVPSDLCLLPRVPFGSGLFIWKGGGCNESRKVQGKESGRGKKAGAGLLLLQPWAAGRRINERFLQTLCHRSQW